jgi:uncharacterized DUF497 family protein
VRSIITVQTIVFALSVLITQIRCADLAASRFMAASPAGDWRVVSWVFTALDRLQQPVAQFLSRFN